MPQVAGTIEAIRGRLLRLSAVGISGHQVEDVKHHVHCGQLARV